MNISTYVVSALVLIIAIMGGVYMLYPNDHTITLMDFTLTLPIAAWVGLPLLLLYFMTILHMTYHGTKEFFIKRRWAKDIESLKDALFWSLLHEPKVHKYHVDSIKEGAVLLNTSNITVNGNIQGLSSKLASVLEVIEDIKSGKYVNLADKKLDKKLSNQNIWVVKNQLNKLNIDKGYAEEVLFAKDNYSDEVVSKAMDTAVENFELYKIKKYSSLLQKRHFDTLIKRLCDKDDTTASMEMLEYFISLFELECRDYIKLVKFIVKKFSPDDNLALIRKLMERDESAKSAYLYLLFEYEMLDTVKHFLEEHDEYEFKPFRAYLILKKNKYNFKIEDLIDSDNICK